MSAGTGDRCRYPRRDKQECEERRRLIDSLALLVVREYWRQEADKTAKRRLGKREGAAATRRLATQRNSPRNCDVNSSRPTNGACFRLTIAVREGRSQSL